MSTTWGRLEAVGWLVSVMVFGLSRRIIGWAVLVPAGLGNADPKVGGPTCNLPLCDSGPFPGTGAKPAGVESAAKTPARNNVATESRRRSHRGRASQSKGFAAVG